MKSVIYKSMNRNLKNEWKKLWQVSETANYFNSPEWFESVLKVFKYDKFIIICMYEKGELMAILTLIQKKFFGIKVYAVSGNYTCGIPFLINSMFKKKNENVLNCVSKYGNFFLESISECMLLPKDYKAKVGVIIPTGKNYFINIKKDKIENSLLGKRKEFIKKFERIENKLTLKTY